MLPGAMNRLLAPLALLVCALCAFAPTDAHGQPAAPAGAVQTGTNPLPITRDDPSWGSPLAPVTLVFFHDLQCPFSARMRASIEELKGHYGPRQLRIVYKHFPLPMHQLARPAAETAVAVHRIAGVKAHERFSEAAFDTLRQSGDHTDALRRANQNVRRVQRMVDGGGPRRKVDEDIALGKRIGVNGTPASFINGVKVSGAQPIERLRTIVDEQLAAARQLRKGGTPAARVYAELTQRQFARPPSPGGAPAPSPGAAPPPPAAKPSPGPDAVWRVPLGSSPALGLRSAWVTLVVISDFQCPFCSRLVPTIEQLRQKYGSRLRVVFKHNPLPFHQRAEPAAQLSLEAFARRGHRGFWEAHDRLFAQQRNLEDADLERIAGELGLNPQRAMRAVRQRTYARHIEADQALAEELEARGTPTCFINGRKLVGARPLGDFERLIDEELDHARSLIQQGVPASQIYGHIQRKATHPVPPPKKRVPRPTRAQPSKGPRHAPVTIQVFSDFQCPHCQRVRQTLDEIRQRYGNQVRLAWRHMPLDMHPDARSAATVAAEAFRQKGSAGFWEMHDLLFANQQHLDRASLLAYAQQMGLEVPSVEQALDTDRHAAAIDRDLAIAKAADIHGTPAFVINGYYLGGAQPLGEFRRLIDRALREARGR